MYMYADLPYKTLEELKKEILFKRISEWDEESLTLEDGTILSIECSEQDCCAVAGGTFENVKLDAVITDVKIHQVEKDREKESDWWSEDEGCNYAEVIIYHNQNPIAQAECYADNGNAGYYYSVCSLRLSGINPKEDFYCEVVRCD